MRTLLKSEYPSMISWCGCHPTLGTWGGEDRFEAYLYIIYVYMYMYMIYIYIYNIYIYIYIYIYIG